MFVEYDPARPPPRTHPWKDAKSSPDAQYWDFRAHPDHIPQVLEDFKPWTHYSAIPRFYEMLAWINGPDSVFESNDCGMLPPTRDSNPPLPIQAAFDSDPIVIHGRLTIIFRELAWNASPPAIESLKKGIHDGLRDHVPNFPAVVKIALWDHLFTAIEKEGHAICLYFWAWGDDEPKAMEFLQATFENLHGCLRWISGGVKERLGKHSKG